MRQLSRRKQGENEQTGTTHGDPVLCFHQLRSVKTLDHFLAAKDHAAFELFQVEIDLD